MSDHDNDNEHGGGHPHTSDSKQCLDLADRLSEYLDDELPADLRAAVREHIDHCSACDRFMVSLSRTKELIHLLPGPELTADRLKVISESVKRRLGESS